MKNTLQEISSRLHATEYLASKKSFIALYRVLYLNFVIGSSTIFINGNLLVKDNFDFDSSDEKSIGSDLNDSDSYEKYNHSP